MKQKLSLSIRGFFVWNNMDFFPAKFLHFHDFYILFLMDLLKDYRMKSPLFKENIILVCKNVISTPKGKNLRKRKFPF